jgi:GTP cyclohydrolase II
MSTSNQKLLETGVETIIVAPNEVVKVTAQLGNHFQVVRGDKLVPEVLAVRDNANLVLHYADGSSVVIENYFNVCEDGGCEVTLPKASQLQGVKLSEVLVSDDETNPEQESDQNASSNPVIVYVEGGSDAVTEIMHGPTALSVAQKAVEDDDDSEGWFSYWTLIGLGAGYGLYEVLLDDGSAPLPAFEGGEETVTVSIAENGPANEIVNNANATAPGETAADSMITYSLGGADASAFSIDASTGELTLLESADYETKSSYNVDVIATSDTTMTSATQAVVVNVTDVPLAVEGLVTGGPVVLGNGLFATAYTTDGTVLGSTKVADDGTFAIDANPDDYTGLVLVRVHDENTDADYLHEGTGRNEDLTVDLRAIGKVDEEGVIRVNVNIASEIAVRQLLSDQGGDEGEASTVLGNATPEQASAHYANVLKAFGLDPSTDLGAVNPHPVNASGFSDAEPAEQALGYLLAIFASAETAHGLSTQEVLTQLTEGSEGGVLSQELLNDLLAAAEHADGVEGNADGSVAFLSNLAQGGVTSIKISDDTGDSQTDFVTNASAQTVSATLASALVGDQAVFGSVDGGETWVAIADAAGSSVSGTEISWATSLSSSAATSKIIIALTADGLEPSSDGANIVGRGLSQSYALDVAAPVLTSTELEADENGTAAGQIASSDDSGIAKTGGYTLGGADADLFSINDAGELVFASAQNFEAPNDGDGDGVYDLTVVLKDAAGNTSGPQALSVTLQNVNETPVVDPANVIPDSTAVIDQAFTLSTGAAFGDPDANDTLTYSAAGLPNGLSIDPATGVISGTATATAAATDIVVTATDSGGLSVTDTFALTVVSAPVINSIALNGGAVAVNSGGSHTFNVTFSEGVTITGGPISLDLNINGSPVTATYDSATSAQTHTFSIIAPAADGNEVEITAINLNGATVVGNLSNQQLITSAVGQTTTDLSIDDTGPSVTTTSLDADENATVIGNVVATDINGIPTTGGYSLGTSGDSARFSISDGGVLSFLAQKDFEAPDDADTNGVYNLEVTVKDIVGNTSTKAVTVNLQNVNESPVVDTPIDDGAAVVDQAFSLNVSGNFSDPDANDTLTYSAAGLPNGLSIDPATGVISGTATATAAATDIVVTATDSGGLSVTDTFALAVVSAPVATTSLNDVTNVDVQTDIVLTFSENVTAATGYIRIVEDSATGFKNDDTVNTQTIDVTSDAVTITDNKVVINPEFDLDFGSNYHIEVDANAFTGVTSGQGSVVINTASSLNFTTVAPTKSGALAQMSKADDTLVDGYTYVDSAKQGSSGPSPSQVSFDASGADYAFVGSLLGAGINQGYDAHMQISNFAANTETGVLTLGDVIYYDNQGENNADFYSSVYSTNPPTKPNTVVGDGTDTKFALSAATGEPGPNTLELLGVNIPADLDTAWQRFTDYEVSAVLVG